MNFLAPVGFTGRTIIYIVILVVLILLSAFFSMSETAISSASDSKIRLLIESRKSGAKKALQLTEKFDKTLIVLLIGNNLVNVAISTIFVMMLSQFIVDNEDLLTWVSTITVTVALLIFGEIFPKIIAKKHAEGISCFVAWPVYIFGLVLTPLVYLFYGIQRAMTKTDGNQEPSMDENELGVLIDQMEDEGSIEHDEATTIRNVFDLNDRTAEDIMIPRIKMEAINYNSSLEDVKNFLIENGYSRVPVYKTDKDHIVGILYERDFFPALIKNPKMSWRRILRPVKFVSGAMKVDALINDLQASKTHIAIVSGEYGDVLGLVTMEDCLEEIVGEIYDEHDIPDENEKRFEEQEDGSYIVDADMFVDDVFEKLNIGDIPEDVPSKLSGWLFAKCESLPEVGFRLKYTAIYTQMDEETEEYSDYAKTLTFEIYEVMARRITLVKLTVAEATEEEIEERNSKLEEE